MNFTLPKSNDLISILIIIDLSVTADTANHLIHLIFSLLYPGHLSPSSLVPLSSVPISSLLIPSLLPNLLTL